MWPIQLPEADAKRADAFVVNRQLIELIGRWQGKERDVSSEETGALHIKGPGLDFIAKKQTPPSPVSTSNQTRLSGCWMRRRPLRKRVNRLCSPVTTLERLKSEFG